MRHWRTYAVVTILLVTLGSVLGACGPKPTPTPTPTPIPPTATPVPPTATPTPPPALPLADEEFRSRLGGFAIRYPEGWVYWDFDGSVIFLESTEAMDEDVPTSPIVLVEGGSLDTIIDGIAAEAKDAEEMTEMAMEDLREEGAEIEILKVEDVKVGGEDAVLVDFTGTGMDEAGTLMAGSIACIHVGDWGVVILGISEADAWRPFIPTFGAMLTSVELFEPEVAGVLVNQWATSATASSQYGDPSWAAHQATGMPDTPECGDIETAWASASGSGVDWIELYYDFPVVPTEVNIIQTYNPSQITEVELIDSAGGYHGIYTAEPLEMEECPYTLSIPVDGIDEAIGVKITVDQSVLGIGWNEIDAVELVGYAEEPLPEPTPVEPTPVPTPPEGLVWRIGDETGFEDDQFNAFGQMAFGPDGNLYVADSLRRILVVSPDGEFLSSFGQDDLWNASGVDIAADGTVYVADWGNNAVYAFTPDGSLLTQWGQAGTGDGEFGDFSPQYLAMCPDGNIYVADSNKDENEESYERIQVFDTDGNYLAQWNISDIDEFFSISGMTCGDDGNIYLVGFVGGYVMVLGPDGTHLQDLGEDALAFTGPHSLALDAEGNIYVGTWNEGMFLLDPDGNLVAQWGESHDEEGPRFEGQLYFPDGIAVDAEGNVYVGDWGGQYSYLTKFVFP